MAYNIFRFTTPVAMLLAVLLDTSCAKKSLPFLSTLISPSKHKINLCWLNAKGVGYDSLGAVIQDYTSKGQSVFACMNGGIYNSSMQPLGLYIENHQQLRPLVSAEGLGNFFMQPNGVFYTLDDGSFHIVMTDNYRWSQAIESAVQSGPLLIIDGKINTQFNPSSNSKSTRNGIGIRADGQAVIAITTEDITFYDFAEFFKQQGCLHALYLDGFISRAYMPEQGLRQTDGHFASILVVSLRQ